MSFKVKKDEQALKAYLPSQYENDDVWELSEKLEQAYKKYQTSSAFYDIGRKIYDEAKSLLYTQHSNAIPYTVNLPGPSRYSRRETHYRYPENVRTWKTKNTDIEDSDKRRWKIAMALAIDVLNNPEDDGAVNRLESYAKNQCPPRWKRFSGALVILAAVAIFAACVTAAVFTFGTSLAFTLLMVGILGGFGAAFPGIGLHFKYKEQSTMPSKLFKLVKVARKKSSENDQAVTAEQTTIKSSATDDADKNYFYGKTA